MTTTFSVTKDGKPLAPSLYNWDEKTRTFSSSENGLVLDFRELSDCTFNTGWDCTFVTNGNCTFKTGSGCTFDTGEDCVNVRRAVFEFYQLPANKKVQTCPNNIKGYVMDGYYWLDGKKQYKAIIADGILSEIIKKKGNVYHVKNHGKSNISYLVTDGENWAHGKTLEQAKDDLIYKISDRDTSAYNDFTLDTELTKAEAIKMYRKITGACDTGCKYFCENNAVPEKMTVAQAIELTQGQYNHNLLVKFFENKGGNNDRC